MIRVSPIEVMTKLRKYDAARIAIAIPVVFIVPSIVSRSIGRVRRRFQAASPAAATTPSAADSLGVAMPA